MMPGWKVFGITLKTPGVIVNEHQTQCSTGTGTDSGRR